MGMVSAQIEDSRMNFSYISAHVKLNNVKLNLISNSSLLAKSSTVTYKKLDNYAIRAWDHVQQKLCNLIIQQQIYLKYYLWACLQTCSRIHSQTRALVNSSIRRFMYLFVNKLVNRLAKIWIQTCLQNQARLD